MNVRLAIMFAAVAEERSFTRAAARLNIAQPWLSAQVRKFEEQLGFQLFDRGKGAIELTPEGEKMFPLALDLAQTANRLRDLARALALDVALVVRVGAHASSAGVPEFARLNDDFAVSYRDTSLIIEAGSTVQLLEEVNSGRLDVALVMAPVDTTGLDTVLLRQTTPYVLATRNSPLAGWADLAPADLAGFWLGVIRRADHPVFFDELHAPLEAAGVTLKPVPETGRRAMEHFARFHPAGVLMVEGDPADYAADPELTAIPVTTLDKVHHLLVKRADIEKRAVDRYWRAAQQAVQKPA